MDITAISALGTWVVKHIIWDEAYAKVKEKFRKDPFMELSEKAVNNVIRENKDYSILLNEIDWEIHEKKIKNILQFNEDNFCELVKGSEKQLCKEFFNKVKEEYVKLIYEEAEKDNPPVKYALDLISEHDDRIKALKEIYPNGPKDYDFETVKEQYLQQVRRNYEHLDFRGIPQVKMFLRVKLDDIFVSLNAVSEKDRDTPEILEREFLMRDRETPEGDEIERLRKEERTAGKSEIDVVEKIEEGKNMVILGSPGSGKTTLLKHSAIKNIKNNLKTPVLLPLREYAVAQLNEDISISEYIPRYFDLQGFELPCDFFSRLIKSGNCLILFDGLDEVTKLEQRKLVAKRVENFINKHRDNNSFIVTSRIVGYREAPLRGDMEHYTVNDFDIEQIRKFVELWCRAVEMSEIKESERTPERTTEADEKAKKECESMLDAVESNPSVMKLATNPLMLTILSLIYRQGAKLPQHRVELYDLCVKTLLESWDLYRRLHHKFDERTALDLLKPLALWLHNQEHSLATRYELKNYLVGQYMEQFGVDKR